MNLKANTTNSTTAIKGLKFIIKAAEIGKINKEIEIIDKIIKLKAELENELNRLMSLCLFSLLCSSLKIFIYFNFPPHLQL